MSHSQQFTIGPVLILPDIRSAQNVGSLFRTADAVGITRIYIVGYTPTPIDRFGKPQKDIAKTALGAETTVSWEYVKSLTSLLTKLKKQGYTLIAIEQAEHSLDYKKVQVIPEKTVCILGNEVTGLSSAVLKKVDIVAEIPMKGSKESLNVAVAGGIVLFRFFDR